MIIYTVICRVKDIAVLVEVSTPGLAGNAPQVTIQLLTHLRDHPDMLVEGEYKTLVHSNRAPDDFFSMFLESCTSAFTDDDDGSVEDYFFHLLLKNGVFYCCISDDPDFRDQKVYVPF